MKKIIIIASAALALAGGGGGAAWFFLKGDDASAAPAQAAAQPDAAPADGAQGAPAPMPAPGAESFYISIQPPIVANYDADGETGYYQVTVELHTYSKELEPLIDTHLPRIRNSLLMLFNNQSATTLKGPTAMDVLRAKAKEEVDKVLTQVAGRSDVNDVFFSGFVIQ